jgi:hypothetical protein
VFRRLTPRKLAHDGLKFGDKTELLRKPKPAFRVTVEIRLGN